MLSSLPSRAATFSRHSALHNTSRLLQAHRTDIPAFASSIITRSYTDHAKGTLRDPHKSTDAGTGPSQNPSYPLFSFRDLGANRTVKIVVVVCVSVLATMESIFWAKVAWAKFGPAEGDRVEVDGSSKR